MSAPMLDVRLFGDFSLRYDGALLTTVSTPRLQSLLAYLLLNRHAPQARQHLAFCFWPDSTEAQARTNLRKLFYQLRQALPAPEQFFYADAQSLQWQASASYRLDVAEFETAIAAADQATSPANKRGQLARAVAGYRGPLLPSCYDEWIFPLREKYHQIFTQALTSLVNLLENDRDYGAALDYAQQLLRVDPLQEATYRDLMRLHALNGNRSLALKAYHTCATTLERELGVRPTAATQADYEALLKLEKTPPAPLERETEAARLVGRSTEWAALQATWQTALHGQLQVALIWGEAGIGKSRLAEELQKWAGRQGIFTAYAQSYSGSDQIAYIPLLAWLRSADFQDSLTTLDDVWLVEIARLLPEILQNKPGLTPPAPLTESWQRRRFFEALSRAVIGAGKPKVLLLDDLQWCDPETMTWLQYLCHFNPQAPLLLVSTLRTEEAAANKALSDWRSALAAANQLTEISLLPLTKAETAILVRQTISRPVSDRLVDRLYQETEGNPLFVIEMAQSVPGQTSEAPAAPSQTRLPLKVQTIIQQRLNALSTPARDLAGLAAIAGRTFTLPILAEATHLDEDRLVRGLDELWQRRIVREREADAYAFSHDIIREVAYETLSLTRRRLYHRRVAVALETVYQAHRDALSFRIGYHYELAGVIKEAIYYYQQAAAAARRIYANQTAISHLQRILTLLDAAALAIGDLEWQQETELQVIEQLGDIFAATGQHEAALARYQQGLGQPSTTAHAVYRARLLLKLGKLFTVIRRNRKALQCYDQAEVALTVSPAQPPAEAQQTWLQIQLERLNTYYWLNEWQTAEKLLEKVRPLVEQNSAPEQQASFFLFLNNMKLRRERYVPSSEMLSDCRRALTIFEAVADQSGIAWASFIFGFTLLWHGDLAAAEEKMLTAFRLAEKAGDLVHQARCLTYLTIVCRQQDRVGEALTYAARSLEVAETVAMIEYQGTAKANQGWAAWRQQNIDQAEGDCLAALALWARSPAGHASCCFQWTARWPLIALALAKDQLDVAVSHAQVMLAPPQQRLPDQLSAILDSALEAWEQGQAAWVENTLEKAVDLAQAGHYL